VLVMVHGTTEAIAWKILATGFATLGTNDQGDYGSGAFPFSSSLFLLLSSIE